MPSINPHKLNFAMDQAHAALRDHGTAFTGAEAHKIITETVHVDLDTAKGLFLMMRVCGYIEDVEPVGTISQSFFRASRNEKVYPLNPC